MPDSKKLRMRWQYSSSARPAHPGPYKTPGTTTRQHASERGPGHFTGETTTRVAPHRISGRTHSHSTTGVRALGTSTGGGRNTRPVNHGNKTEMPPTTATTTPRSDHGPTPPTTHTPYLRKRRPSRENYSNSYRSRGLLKSGKIYPSPSTTRWRNW